MFILLYSTNHLCIGFLYILYGLIGVGLPEHSKTINYICCPRSNEYFSYYFIFIFLLLGLAELIICNVWLFLFFLLLLLSSRVLYLLIDVSNIKPHSKLYITILLGLRLMIFSFIPTIILFIKCFVPLFTLINSINFVVFSVIFLMYLFQGLFLRCISINLTYSFSGT